MLFHRCENTIIHKIQTQRSWGSLCRLFEQNRCSCRISCQLNRLGSSRGIRTRPMIGLATIPREARQGVYHDIRLTEQSDRNRGKQQHILDRVQILHRQNMIKTPVGGCTELCNILLRITQVKSIRWRRKITNEEMISRQFSFVDLYRTILKLGSYILCFLQIEQ